MRRGEGLVCHAALVNKARWVWTRSLGREEVGCRIRMTFCSLILFRNMYGDGVYLCVCVNEVSMPASHVVKYLFGFGTIFDTSQICTSEIERYPRGQSVGGIFSYLN